MYKNYNSDYDNKKERDLCGFFSFLSFKKKRIVLISVTPGIYPYRCCFMTILSNFNSILINISALSQSYGTTTGHVHFMTRGGGGYALVLTAPLTYFIVNKWDRSSILPHDYYQTIPFHLVLSVKYNINVLSSFSHMKMNFSKVKHKNKFLPK